MARRHGQASAPGGPGGGRALAAATRQVADDLRSQGLAQRVAEAAAGCWSHSAAVVRWCEDRGLLPRRLADTTAGAVVGTLRDSLAELAGHPACAALADPAVNPAMAAPAPGPAACAAAAAAWARLDVREHGWDTRGVGDLYEALSAPARAGNGLCQTPAFVTDLILKCTLDRVGEDHGRDGLRLVDPACGTGHFLLDAAARMFPPSRSRPHADATYARLAAVHGVDIDPYAAAVARWRLVAFACARLGIPAWAKAPADLPVQVAAADALLGCPAEATLFDQGGAAGLLAPGRYHVVVGNPPYIVPGDAAHREAIRAAYRDVCAGRYSLAVPFMVLFHRLAVDGGWVGQITTNAWMKREYGRRLVEAFLPTVDLQWVIDTSGAYIPGHGTPTVILVSRNQPPSGDTVKTIMGRRGEPRAPADPAEGLVWTAIRDAVHLREDLDRFARGAARYAAEQAGGGGR